MKCFYHANCNDGSGAALAVWMARGDEGNEYIPVQYGSAPPKIEKGDEVIIVDFSYSKTYLQAMAQRASSILVIDHHKTAEEQLRGVDDGNGCRIDTVFDMHKSGAVLAWEHFMPGGDEQWLFNAIQDRDLWKFEMSDTMAIHAALCIEPDWREWVRYVEPNGHMRISSLITQGEAINKFMRIQMEKILNRVQPHRWNVTGEVVPVFNLPGFMISDTLHMALERYTDAPYAVNVMHLPEKNVYSLRSRSGEDVDVSAICRRFGGGGHMHAAGFSK